MATQNSDQLSTKLLKEIHATALTLQETADRLSKLTRLVRPDVTNCRFIVEQAYTKVRNLAKQFEIDV